VICIQFKVCSLRTNYRGYIPARHITGYRQQPNFLIRLDQWYYLYPNFLTFSIPFRIFSSCCLPFYYRTTMMHNMRILSLFAVSIPPASALMPTRYLSNDQYESLGRKQNSPYPAMTIDMPVCSTLCPLWQRLIGCIDRSFPPQFSVCATRNGNIQTEILLRFYVLQTRGSCIPLHLR
jgi:hypothetical protein